MLFASSQGLLERQCLARAFDQIWRGYRFETLRLDGSTSRTPTSCWGETNAAVIRLRVDRETGTRLPEGHIRPGRDIATKANDGQLSESPYVALTRHVEAACKSRGDA